MNFAIALAVLTGGVSLVGLRSALFMYGKSRAAQRGQLSESSVVELPEARLFFAIPNALVGIAYYLTVIALAGVVWSSRAVAVLLVALTLCALATSIFLALRLLKRGCVCRHCWTSHAVNTVLFLVAFVQFARAGA